MRLGIFGGTFDPVHLGHVLPLRAALHDLALDRILVFPTARPPHKPEREPAPAAVRFAMVELAFLGDPEIRVSPYETERDEATYTIDTVRWVAGSHPGADLHLLVGEDSVRTLDSWREWEGIVERVTLVGLSRPGTEGVPGSETASGRLPPFLRDAGARVRWLDSVRVDVSSTEIRDMLARGEDPGTGRVPGPVLDYLRKYDDYREPRTTR